MCTRSAVNWLSKVSFMEFVIYINNFKTFFASHISEMRKTELTENLERVLAREKVECIRKNCDLGLELYDYSTMLDRDSGTYGVKKIASKSPVSMEQFFEQINPNMSYLAFLKKFIQMLYHCFILKHSPKNDATDVLPNGKASQHLDVYQVFSQFNTQVSFKLIKNQQFVLILFKFAVSAFSKLHTRV